MAEFERTTTVSVSPDVAFQFLAAPANLPKYVARMNSAEVEQGGRLHVAADVQGRHEEGEARFRADPADCRIEWSGDADSSYQGWLQVAEAENGASVTIHLHVEHDQDRSEVERVLTETLANIERVFSAV